MVRPPRTTESVLWRPALFRFVVLALLLTGLVNGALPAQEPAPAPNIAGAFRQFLRTDMDQLGKLLTLRDETCQQLEREPENTEKHAYCQKVVDALTQQIE